MKITEARHKIDQIIDLIHVLSLAQEWCATTDKPMSCVVDFVVPTLKEIQEGLQEWQGAE